MRKNEEVFALGMIFRAIAQPPGSHLLRKNHKKSSVIPSALSNPLDCTLISRNF